jgi:hypothetical protein
MKKNSICILICVCLFAFASFGCGQNTHKNQAQIPNNEDELVGENYKTIRKEFKKNGFTNIEVHPKRDLITGWITKNGEVSSVRIGGKKDFSYHDWIDKDTKVKIVYHAFPKDNQSDNNKNHLNNKATKNSQPTQPKYYNDTSSYGSENARREAALKIAEKQPNIVLNASNNSKLSEILQLKDPADPKIKEFSLNYYGWTIEFDGCIWSSIKENKYNYRVMAGAGNYDPNVAYGPQFLMTGIWAREYPAAITEGMNVHIKGTVGEYNDTTQMFDLSLKSINYR